MRSIMFLPWTLALWFMSSASSMPNRRREGLDPEIFFRSVPLDFPTLTFAENECNSTEGRKGWCVGYPECEGVNAVREGTCSDGFGTCCIYLMGSPKTSDNVKFTVYDWGSSYSNRDFPRPTLLAKASVQIPIEQDVCQIRLDFESLDLPENTVFETSIDGDVEAPILTGNNTGQHLILNVDEDSPDQSWVSLNISGPVSPKTWSIHLTNVPCYSSNTAPAGCTQYFRSPSGRIRSLNVYSDENSSYAVCLRARDPTKNLLSLRSFASGAACDSSVQVPAGAALNGLEIPSRICAKDDVEMTYKVSGPLVLYMKTTPGQRGVDLEYDL